MAAKPAPMKGSLKIGSFAGIGVFVHWSFFLLPAVMAASRLLGEGPLTERVQSAVFSVLLVLATFACVVLHEFGHALTARRFGVRTRDIVLLPIGGVARLERIPRNPIQELWIALAGPAVNVVIASVIAAGLALTGLIRGDFAGLATTAGPIGFIVTVGMVNVVLIVFNMIPAFPMDGGRVLRALLAFRLDYSRATTVAARVGQVIAVAFFVTGIFTGNIVLILVGGMVFLGAAAEARQAVMLDGLGGVTVRQAMMTEFHLVPAGMPLSRCAELLIAGSQRDFPVVETDPDGEPRSVIGILSRGRLMDAIANGKESEPAAEHATRGGPVFKPDDEAVAALERMQSAEVVAALVVDQNRPVGLVTLENIAELLELRSARGARTHGQSPITR